MMASSSHHHQTPAPPPHPPPAAPEASAAEKLEQTEQQIEVLIETFRQLGIMVSSFDQPTAQSSLNMKFETMVSLLRKVETSSKHFGDVLLPMQILDYVDEGRNPQMYTRDILQQTVEKNEEVNRKIETIDRFRTTLMVELKDFPQEMAKYRTVRGFHS